MKRWIQAIRGWPILVALGGAWSVLGLGGPPRDGVAEAVEPAGAEPRAAGREEVSRQVEDTVRAYESRIRELEERLEALEARDRVRGEAAEEPSTGEEAPAAEAEDPGLDAIFSEVGGQDASDAAPEPAGSEPPAEATERTVADITREAGEATGPKNQWFPSILNPQIGVMIETLGRFGTQRENQGTQNTLDMRELELNLYGNFDPVGKAFALISGSDEVSVEEAYFLFTGIPFDVQLRAGKFFTKTSFLNKTHTHDLPFVDQPVTMQNYLGEPEPLDPGADGVLLGYAPQYVSTGGELSWLVPTSWYWKIQASMYQGFSDRSSGSFWSDYVTGGGPPIEYDAGDRGIRDFVYHGGTSLFFELSDDHSLKLAGNFLYDGPKDEIQRFLESAAVSYVWFPLEGGLYHGLEWTTEVFANQERFLRDESGVPDADSWGVYSYVDAKLSRRFSAGVLGEWSEYRFDEDADGWKLGGWLSYHISERQRIRFQVDRVALQEWYSSAARRGDLDRGDGDFWQFTLQWVVVLGAHTHTYD